MKEVYGKAIASIESTDDDKFGPNGGFTAVLSTPSLDRDGDRLHRDEWIEPLADRYPLDIDHGMSVADTVGSFHPYFEGERMLMDAYFASTPKAQEVRTLVLEGHISNVSVAFLTDKSKKDSEPKRELLNAGIVATPSNRDAVILASKAASALKDAFSDVPEGDMPEEVIKAVSELLLTQDGTEETKAPKPYGDVHYADPSEGKYPVDTVEHIRAALRFIGVAHNRELLGDHLASTEAAIHAAARAHGIDPHGGGKAAEAEAKETKNAKIYVDVVPRFDYEGFATNLKAAMTASGIGGDGALVQAIHDASSHLGAACPVIEVSDEGDGASSGANKSIEPFEKRLDQILQTEESPAEAAAASDEEPAPADKAADDSEVKARAMQMGLGLLTTLQ